MNYFVTKYPQGTFSWTDVTSSDIKATKEFLTKFFGWTAEDMPTGQGDVMYTMFSLDGKIVAGGGPMMESMKGVPSFWGSYITVDDIEAMIAKAKDLGGKVLFGPIDIPGDAGKMASIEDPTGANVNFWQPKKHIGASVVNIPGAMGWNELYVHDLEKAKKFYADLFGWTYEIDPKSGYAMIQNKGRANGGMMTITPEMVNMPPNWTVYFSVKNIEEAISQVKELGGQVFMGPKDLGVGKIAMVAEPAGAQFIIIELATPPDEWKE